MEGRVWVGKEVEVILASILGRMLQDLLHHMVRWAYTANTTGSNMDTSIEVHIVTSLMVQEWTAQDQEWTAQE